MIAEQVRDTDLADYQRTVRLLLVHPLVTATSPHPGALRSVRRFAATLAVDLDTLAGYHLEVAPTCARLRRRLDRLDPTQQLRRRRDRKPFDRRRYAYLCLVLSVLDRAGSQVALTELASALKRRAAEIDGLAFDPDEYRHRLAFVDVVRHLLELGALREVETSTVDWVRDPEGGEALYDLDRDVLHLVFTPPRVLQHVRSAGALAAGEASTDTRDVRRAAIRRRLVRLLLEHPVVHLDDLDDAERTYLTSQGRALAADLHRLTGGQLERRAEGVALVDTTGGFSDRRFPAGGTAAQVALLLADAMSAAVAAGEVAEVAVPTATQRRAAIVERLDAARPSGTIHLADDPTGVAGAEVEAREDGAAVARSEPAELMARGPLFTDAWLEARADALATTHGRSFSADLRDDPAALVTAACEVLAAFDLVRPVPGGVVARPAIARYRDVVVHTPEPAQPHLLLLDATAEDRP